MTLIKRRPRADTTRLYRRIIIGSASLLLIVSFIVLSVVLSVSVTPMEEHSFNAASLLSSDPPIEGLLNPDSEVRGVWIATVENINFPSKPGLDAASLMLELDAIVANVKALNLNAIYFQVRPTSDALYDSALFPTSKYLTGDQSKLVPGGFDPLGYLLEKAHAENIAVHAWVNPLRVTSGTANAPEHDLSKLAPNNPARLFPEWTVPYADGKLYYNAGIPGVRELVAAGVAEIVKKYDVDGIVFDDYFYPYPVSGAKFDDDEEYKLYGNGMKLGDWRRENINLMMRDCYIAVKSVDPDCLFGAAPFGIWQNDDGKNGGSATTGMEAYESLYCDALAWIEGGYIDYIAPQIYWQFSTSSARYDTLVRWWNKQLEGHDNIDLLICHAAYRSAEWGTENEIRNQVEYARSELSYTGSIFYGWAAIMADDMGLKNQIKSLYEEPVIYGKIQSNGSEVVVNSPLSGTYINETNTYLLGKSDPAYPLFLDGEEVSRTKGGYFSLYVPLKKGKNEFVFTQNGVEYTHVINRGVYTSSGGTKTYAQLDSYAITSFSPTCGYMVPGGTVIKLSVTAPSGSSVTAALGSRTVRLSPTINPPNQGNYMSETYTGSISVPGSPKAGEILEIGNIVFTAKRGNETASAVGSRVRAAGSGAVVTVEAIKDDSEMKLSRTSWYYDDYTPASKGMRDAAVSLSDGYYKLSMGAYIAEEDVVEVNRGISIASITSAYMLTDKDCTAIYIGVTENVPLNGFVEKGKFHLTLYNVDPSTAQTLSFADNPFFNGASQKKHTKANSYRYTFDLIDVNNFYGFTFSYVNGHVKVNFNNPEALPVSDKPLAGKTIILDAGHGGVDTGARGADPDFNEADMNLAIVLEAAPMLERLGANVILTRTEDVTMDIYERLDMIEAVIPDLLISVHQNSMGYNTDITKIRGLVALHFSDAGKLLNSSVSGAMADSLARYERTPSNQRLAMVRNVKFPSTLVEVSFITCIEEYDMMLREGSFRRAAEGLTEGVLDFYRNQAKYVK